MPNEKNEVTVPHRKTVIGRATKQSREAIAQFVQMNLPRLDSWLQQVANGLPKLNAQGEPLRDGEGSIIFVVRPDPQAAIKCVADICEYHIPKLSRAEVSATLEHLPVEQRSTEQLQRQVLESLGLTTYEPEDVEPIERSDG
jgi:hypothetical protein